MLAGEVDGPVDPLLWFVNGREGEGKNVTFCYLLTKIGSKGSVTYRRRKADESHQRICGFVIKIKVDAEPVVESYEIQTQIFIQRSLPLEIGIPKALYICT